MTSRDSASAIRVLRWLIAASIVFPLALFGYAGVTNYRAAWTGADERIERTLDVLQEHALKVFETVAPEGGFAGVAAVSVLPREIKAFYARLGRGLAFSASLIRGDGTFLARYPSPDERPLRLTPDSVFVRAIATRPEAGIFSATSQVDQVGRRIGYRKLPGYPVYVQAGLETRAIEREWLATVASHLVFGVPATVFLFAISLLALRRTARFYAEAERREARKPPSSRRSGLRPWASSPAASRTISTTSSPSFTDTPACVCAARTSIERSPIR